MYFCIQNARLRAVATSKIMKKYYSKILLLGEYTIIQGSSALAVPYARYAGHWALGMRPSTSNTALMQWLAYLQGVEVHFDMALEAFAADVERGLLFQSNIPQGYGVGSSGALVAAFYDRYVTKIEGAEASKISLLDLKKRLQALESYFHGGGSGLDPLICHLNAPLLATPDGGLTVVQGLPLHDAMVAGTDGLVCFLLDTGLPRKTEPLVAAFLAHCEAVEYDRRCREELAQYNNAAIQCLLDGVEGDFMAQVRAISAFQAEHMSMMIPSAFQRIWSAGLAEDAPYHLKLCGAGGGGFIIGFARDWARAQAALSDYDCELAFRLF